MEILPSYLEFHLPTAIRVGPILERAIDLNSVLEIESIGRFVNCISL